MYYTVNFRINMSLLASQWDGDDAVNINIYIIIVGGYLIPKNQIKWDDYTVYFL